MSKQSEAKEAQGYRTEPQNCGNCQHRKWKKKAQGWCEQRNEEARADGRAEPYPLAVYGTETENRCDLGGFAVKKTATCNRWARLMDSMVVEMER